MKILGTKFFGLESAVFFLDTEKMEIFAINSDRISRIKKDNFDISPVLDNYSNPKFSIVDEVAYPFNNFLGRDALLETKGTSYYWLNWQRILRNIIKPRFRSDLLSEKDIYEQIYIFFNSLLLPKIFYYKVVRGYYWRKYLLGTLPKNFHQRKIQQYIEEVLLKYNINAKKIKYFDHHTCHAFSAYFFSQFSYKEDALVFTLDEHGDECFSKLFLFKKVEYSELAKSNTNKFWIEDKVHVTSIAGLYSNFTEAMGLIRSTDEGKIEALAAYGEVDEDLFNEIISMVSIEDLEYKFDLDQYKKYSDIAFLSAIKRKIGGKNFCATIQHWLEEVVVEYLNQAYQKYEIDNLCLAGGAVANVIVNYKIYEKTPFKNIFIVPPMGDEGSAAGAAIMSALNAGKDLSWLKKETMPYFGPCYSREDTLNAIKHFQSINYEDLGDDWPIEAAKAICDNNIIGIYQGRMEFGPRALGNRSILANAADKNARDKINSTIKRRPWYQPFCPSVLEEERARLFENSFKHKYMATAFKMKMEYRDKLPSAIHVDGTARPQFVEFVDNPNFYRLLKEIQKKIGYGVVINTSFNLHGRPIVNTPQDAIVDFIDCNIDELYIEGYRVKKVN